MPGLQAIDCAAFEARIAPLRGFELAHGAQVGIGLPIAPWNEKAAVFQGFAVFYTLSDWGEARPARTSAC